MHDRSHYEAAFPGHEDVVGAEWDALQEPPSGEPEGGLSEPLEIGPFTAQSEIGRGGQGIVYRARDARLERDVALKVVPTAGLDDTLLARIRREAATLARLDHPGICPIHETGQSGAVAWIAMPFVQGATLSDTLAQKVEVDRPWLERCVSWVKAAAQAVHAAHEEGVIHRDLKPGNIMIRPDDGPVILDFGLARDLDPATASLTLTGDFLGTPSYMAPEQFEPRLGAVGVRADVWALGAILFECCTLTRPFTGATISELSRRITDTAAPHARDLNRAVPVDLSLIIARSLERDAFRRYSTAADLAADLDRWLARMPVSARPVGVAGRLARWARRRPALAMVASALVVTLIVATAILINQNLELQRAETGLTLALDAERDRRSEAEAESRRANRVLDFLESSIIQGTDGRTNEALRRAVGGGQNVDIRTLLTHAAESIGDRFEEHPATEVMIRLSLGLALVGQGQFEAAVNALDPGLPLAHEAFGAASTELKTLKARLGHALLFGGDAKRAAEVLEDLVHGQGSDSDDEDEGMLQAEGDLALAYQQLGKSEKAIRSYRSILERGEGVLAPDSDPMLQARTHLALILWTKGATDEARRHLTMTIKTERERQDPRGHVLCQNLRTLATMQWKSGERSAAVATIEEALSFAVATHGDHHPNTMDIRRDKALQYKLLGKLELSIQQLDENIRIMEAMSEPPLDRLLPTVRTAGELSLSLKRHPDAARYFAKLAKLEELKGDISMTRRATTMLATCSAWLRAGDRKAARQTLSTATALFSALEEEELSAGLLKIFEGICHRALDLCGPQDAEVIAAVKFAMKSLERTGAADRAGALERRLAAR